MASIPKTDFGGTSTMEQRLNLGAAISDPDNLIYTIHAGPVASVNAVYDRGISLVIDGDEPDLAALERAKISPGHARTCCAEGLIRLGAVPDEPVTADADGEGLGPSFVFRASDLAGGVTPTRRAELAAAGLLVTGG